MSNFNIKNFIDNIDSDIKKKNEKNIKNKEIISKISIIKNLLNELLIIDEGFYDDIKLIKNILKDFRE